MEIAVEQVAEKFVEIAGWKIPWAPVGPAMIHVTAAKKGHYSLDIYGTEPSLKLLSSINAQTPLALAETFYAAMLLLFVTRRD